MIAQISSLQPALTGAAADMAHQISTAEFLSSVRPLRDAVKASPDFSEAEKTLLLTLAIDREDELYRNYLGREVYPDARR